MSKAKNTPAKSGSPATARKPGATWATVKRLAGYMKKSGLLVALTLVAAIAGTIMQVLSPKELGRATTAIFNGLRSGRGIDFGALSAILFIVIALYVGVFLAMFLQQRFMVVIAQKTTYALRNELKVKMNKVPVSYFDKNSNGALMSVAVNDIDNIVTNLQQSVTGFISSVILIIGIAWMMFSINVVLALVTCVMVPLGLVLMKAFTPTIKKNSRIYFSSLGGLNGEVEESYQGFAVLKSFNGEDAALQEFQRNNTDMYERGWRARFVSSIITPFVGFLYNMIYVAIAVIGAVYVITGAISLGNMQAFLQYSSQFSIPFSQFAQLWGNIVSLLASAERVFDMIDAQEMVTYEKTFPDRPREKSRVVFEGVKFGYTLDEPLMKNFNMEVADGQMIAIVGHTGAGKTTLINLLERFYEIDGGGIRVKGIDIRNIERSALRRQMGMVLQDTWLFSGSISDNIRYGNEGATAKQIEAAAKAASVDDFVAKLPEGYDTLLNEDADNISQGQRQLITIARAFVSDPEILILDEATSNVDSRTELIIQRAMKRLLKGRTSFVIAHRLSTIYDADRILVMDAGDIVETGNHEELLAAGGVYAEIYNSQFMGMTT